MASNPGATQQQIADWWKGPRDTDTGIKGARQVATRQKFVTNHPP